MSKLLGIGTRVKFLTTTDSGVIVSKLGNGMVMVLLDDDDMEIPAFEDDLIREEDYIKAKDILPLATPSFKNEIEKKTMESQFKPELTDSGVHLALQPIKKNNDEIDKMIIILMNDTPFDILYECDYVLFDEIEWSKEGKLLAVNFETLGEMLFDDINDLPEFDIAVSPVTTEGVGEKIFKTLKIKPKQLLKSLTYSYFLDRDVYHFLIVKNFNPVEKKDSDLEKYTEDVLKTKKTQRFIEDNSYSKPYNPTPDTNEYASFVPEIDLHIELLHDNPSKLTNTEIVNLQIKTFEAFLSKAIRLNVPKIYAIHGIGTGKLRDMIAARLRRHPDVLMFKNQYHEKYGWGATEIWLR
jgi:hypothetical protein